MSEIDCLVTLNTSGHVERILVELRAAGFDVTNVFPEIGVVVVHGPEAKLDQIKHIPGVSTVDRQRSMKSLPPAPPTQ